MLLHIYVCVHVCIHLSVSGTIENTTWFLSTLYHQAEARLGAIESTSLSLPMVHWAVLYTIGKREVW